MNRNFSSFLFIKQNLLAKLLVLIACACFVGKGWGQTPIGASPYTVPSTGTYTVPAGVTSLTIQCWGGGGGGGSIRLSSTGGNGNSGGGGGGGTCSVTTVSVNPGDVLTITIGTAGTAGTSGGTGGSGGTSSVVNALSVTIASAGGGAGGVGRTTDGGAVGTGGAGSSSGTGTIRSGGNGASGFIGGSFNVGGGGGGSGGTTANGGNATPVPSGNNGTSASVGGTAGASGGGVGANGVAGSAGNNARAGVAGTIPGGGGSGAAAWNTTTNYAGGAGAIGRVIIIYSAPVCSVPTSISATSNSPICAGSTLNLTGAATGNTSWSWLGPNNFSSTVQSPSIASATTAASGTYFLTAQNSCGTGSGLFDNFSDNNFTSNPVWTPEGAYTYTAASGVLQPTSSTTDERITTPSTHAYGSWKFDFQLVANVNSNDVIRLHMISNNTTLNNSSGYYVRISGVGSASGGNGIHLYRIDNSTTQVSLGSVSYTPSTSMRTMIVTRGSDNVFRVYLDGSSTPILTTTADGTYTTSSFAGVWTSGNNGSTNHIVDNIVCSSTLVNVTVNPIATAGTFQYANLSTQTICAGSTISCSDVTSPTNGGAGTLTTVWYCGELNTGGTIGGNYGAEYGNWRESTLLNVSGTTSSSNLNAAAGGGAGTSFALTNYNPQSDFPGKTNFVIIRRAYNSLCGVCVGGCQDQYFYLNLTPVTAAPTISTPICSGATTISGTSAANASVIVTLNGVAQTPVTANGSGNWSATVSPLTASQSITATAQVSGQCVSSNSNSVTISSSPTTATVSSATLSVCGSLTSGSLGGNTPTNGTGTWSIFSGGSGSFSSINSGSSTFTANAYGTYVLRWTISNSPCGSSTADVTVTFTPSIGWANTSFPSTGTVCTSGNFDVYGQVYSAGVTEAGGQGAGVSAELGWSTSNTNPSTWTNWTAAVFNSQQGNNDQFFAQLTSLAAGTYYYAYRYSINGCSYTYGGTGGVWSSNSGVLTVNDCYGSFGSAVYMQTCSNNVNSNAFFRTEGTISSNNFTSNNFGSYYQNSGALKIQGGEVKTWKAVGANVCTPSIYYRVYPTGAPTGAYSPITLPFYENCSGTAFASGDACTNIRDQKWQRPGSGNPFSNIDLTTYAPGTYQIEVYYEIPGNHLGTTGCPNTVYVNNNGTNYIASFTIVAAPSASNTGPYCVGNTIQLNASNASSYSWSGSNSFSNSTQNPTIANATSAMAGTYTITAALANGCSQTATTAVVVNSPTTPTFNQVAAICSGGSLSALPTTSTNSITGTWAPALDNTQTTTYTFTPTAGLCATTTTMTITVNPLPSGIANSNSPFCAGQAINLTATDGFSTYAWSGPNSFSNATQNPSISNAQAVNAGTYTLTVTDGNGCQATSSTVVSLTTSPTAANNGLVCVGGALSLSTNSATSYSWSGPNSFTSSIQNPSVSASATTAMAGTYTVSIVGGCASATGVVDNFSDGNFTSNPAWTTELGGWQVSSGYLRGDNTVTVDKIRTPSTQAYGTWNFDFQFQTTSGTTVQVVRVFPIATLTTLNSGYCVYIDGGGAFQLRRMDNGTPTTLINATWTPNLQWRTVKVIREFDNTFKLYLGGVLMGTSSAEATYTTSTHFGVWNSGSFTSDNHYIDNISCSPPATATTTVVVNSAPTISNKTGTICSGNTYTMATAAPDVVPSGTTYSWSFTANPSITGATTGTAQSSFAQTLTNTSSMPQTIIYSVIPTVGSCSGTAFTVTITVDALLNGGTVTTDQTICSGGIPSTLTSVLLPSGGSGLGITGSVQIGTQYWMNSNLNVVNYNDGTPVGTNFIGTAGAYSWYSNSLPTWGQYYGGLYNWYAVNTGKLCPSGWHVPTQAEWNTLITTAGGTLVAGKKLKSCRTVNYGCPTTLDPRWDADANDFGTDDFGFAALPAGRAYISSGNLIFERVRTRTRFWASTQNDASNGDTYEFNDNSSGINVFYHPKDEGYSVRCMGDNATTIQNSYTYQWQQDPGCTGTWSNISGATSLTYSPGALTQTTCFRRITTDACGTTFSNTITITVTTGPVITAMTATICSGQTFSVTPVNGTNGTVPVGTTYTWSAPVISPASSITGGSAQATAQTSISQTLTNTITSNATATYTVTATSGSCSSTFTVTVTVLPPLVAGTVAGISSGGGGPGHLVISQIYGGGGNSGSLYTHDFVELFNPTASAVNLSGWSLQYTSATGTGWGTSPSPLSLSGSIQPGSYFLVQMAIGTGGTIALPTPDQIGTIFIAGTAGKIALVNLTTALSGTCPTGTNIIDFVGFGTTANCYEGASSAPAPSNTTWITRALNGCQDTQVNSADFTPGNTTTPRNSASPTNFCTTTSLTETICANATASSITATAATGSSGSFTYQWYSQAGNVACPTGSSTIGWTLIPGETNLTYSPGTVASTTTYALFITPTGAAGCTGTWATDCRKVLVNPAPIITDITTSVCGGIAFSATPVDVTNGTVPAGTTYSWSAPSIIGITGTVAGSNAAAITGTLTNTTNVPINVVYTITPTTGTCVGAAFTVTVTVNPSPVLSNANTSVCSPDPFTFTPSNGTIPIGTTYSWSAPTGANFTGGASGSGATTINGTLTLSSGSSATAVYTVTPSLGTCSGATFTLTVNLSDCAPAVPFTECNLVVYEVGNNTSLDNNAFPVSVKEITPNGVNIQTISNAFISSNVLTQNGLAASVGFLNSYNGFLSVPGYSVVSGTALNITAPVSADLINKVNSILDVNGLVQSYTPLPTTAPIPFSGNHIRSTLPLSSTTFYATGTGGNDGLYYHNGTTFNQLVSLNARGLEIFNNQLYISTSANILSVGTGLPTTGTQTTTALLPTYSNSSIYGFSISSDGCTMYVADNGSNANYRGVSKYKLISGTWTYQYNYQTWGIGLVVDYSGTNDIVYVTTATNGSNTPNKIEKLIDNPTASSFTVETTGWPVVPGTNNRFAGIDFTPNSTSAIANPITTQPIASASLCNTQTQTLSVTTSGSPTYQWYSNTVNSTCGATSISGAVNATYTPPATGVDGTVYYFVKVSVNCSQIFLSNISAITTIINPTPIATNYGPICVGTTLTLATPTVSGATYSWTGPNSFASSTQNPTVTTNASSIHQGTYSVTTTVNGCTSIAGTTVVTIYANPSLIFLSPP